MVATTSQMVFPHNEAVVNATHKKGRKNLLLLLLVPRRARGQLPLLLQDQVQTVCLTDMFISSSIDHNTSIMTVNAEAYSAFLPQGLELVPMT